MDRLAKVMLGLVRVGQAASVPDLPHDGAV